MSQVEGARTETALRPLILTLVLDAQLFKALNALRVRHFPPERNVVPAHVTLFHALPSEHEAMIADDLDALCAATVHAPKKP